MMRVAEPVAEKIRAARAFVQRVPFLITMLTMGWNLVFALFNGVFSLIYSSYWYLTMFALYLLMGLMKLSAVTVSKSKRRTEADMLCHTALAMFGLAVIVCGLMILTIRESRNPPKNKAVMVITAAYTLIFVLVTIRNTVVAHRQRSQVMIALRNISCAGAIVSILSLERSMLGTFGAEAENFILGMEAWSGGIAFLILIVLGISMLVLSGRQKRSKGAPPAGL